MTIPPDFEVPGDVRVRPCVGRLTVDGQPRHARPARAGVDIPQLWAVEYGLRDDQGQMVKMDLGPLLDAVAARYDGCQACEEHQIDRIVADPVMTAHTVGVALFTFNKASCETPTAQITTQLQESGVAIAVALRSVGLAAAVGVAEAMVEVERRDAVRVALRHLLPVHVYGAPLSSTYPAEHDDGREVVDDDATILDLLRARGLLPEG